MQVLAVVLLLLAGGSLAVIGIPIWRQRSAIVEIERVGGTVRTVPGGPTWLRQFVGGDWMWYFDDVVHVTLDDPRATNASLVCLKGLPRLGELSLAKSQVTDEGLVHLQGLTGLVTLSLAGTRVGDAGMAHLTGLTGLTILDLNDTQVTDAGLSQLQELVKLEQLSLANTPVTDAGLAQLSGLTGLRSLVLSATQVTDACLETLKPLPRLQSLMLFDTQVTDDGFAKLERSRPVLAGGPRDYYKRRSEQARGPQSLFEQIVFGRRGAKGARSRLDRILARKIGAIGRICGLTQTQTENLELAGRQDIAAAFERINEQQAAAKPAAGEHAKPDPARLERETSALRVLLGNGPFGEESRFAGMLQSILTPEQQTQYAARSLTARDSKKKIDILNAADLERISDLPIDASRIVWNRAGTQVAFVRRAGGAEIYDASLESPIRTIGKGKLLSGFDFSPEGDFVAICDQISRNALILNVATGAEVELKSPNMQPGVRISPDGTKVATGGYGSSAHLWSVPQGTLIRQLNAGREGALTIEFSPEGTLLAVGNRNSTTQLFNGSTGDWRGVLPGKFCSHELRFDPAGKTLAVVYVDGSLALWDLATASLKQAAQADADELYTVDWSPDGSLLVTAGRNSLVTLWTAQDLTVVNELESPEWVSHARFGPDGTRLLFSGGPSEPVNRRVEIWGVR